MTAAPSPPPDQPSRLRLPRCTRTSCLLQTETNLPPQSFPVIQSQGGGAYAILRTLVHEKTRIAVLLGACIVPPPPHRARSDVVGFGSRVAIKVSYKASGEGAASTTSQADSLVIEQARAEVSALLWLSTPGHPHVLPVIEALEDDEAVYTILPYLPGRDLCDKMRARGGRGVSERCARNILSQVVSGLLYIKQKGLAHGDVSLENVMMDENQACQLIDLGMCVQATPTPIEVRPDLILGKPSYICPEAAALQRASSSSSSASSVAGAACPPTNADGAAPPTTASQASSPSPVIDPLARDAWGLGVLLFILLMGCPPCADINDPAFAILCGSQGPGGLDAIIDCYTRLSSQNSSRSHSPAAGGGGMEDDSLVPSPRRPMSEEARALLRGLLTVDPSERMTLEQVLQHPWMANHHHHHHHHHHHRTSRCKRNSPRPSHRHPDTPRRTGGKARHEHCPSSPASPHNQPDEGDEEGPVSTTPPTAPPCWSFVI